MPRPGRRGAGLLRDREDPAGHTPRPIADAKPGRQASGQALHRAGEDPDAIGQQPAVGRVVDGRLDHRRVHPQAASVHHAPLTCDRDEAVQQLLEHRPIQHVRQADQCFGVRDALAIDAAERSVDEAPPDFPLALVEAPVREVLEHEHPERDGGGRAEPPAPGTQGVAPRQGRRDLVHQVVVLEDEVDLSQDGIPQLVRVGQQDFDQGTLRVGAPDHGASDETGGLRGCTA